MRSEELPEEAAAMDAAIQRVLSGVLVRDGFAEALALAVARALPVLVDAAAAARLVGCRSRYALGRELQRRRLPSFRRFRGLVWAEWCLARSRRLGWSLERLAHCDNVDPRVYRRRIKSVTGRTWATLGAGSELDLGRAS